MIFDQVIDRARLTELEPHAAGIKAIHVPEAGIVNYKQVCQRLAERVREHEGQVLTSARVTKVERNGEALERFKKIAFETVFREEQRP